MIGQHLRGLSMGKLVLGIGYWALGTGFKVSRFAAGSSLHFDGLKVIGYRSNYGLG